MPLGCFFIRSVLASISIYFPSNWDTQKYKMCENKVRLTCRLNLQHAIVTHAWSRHVNVKYSRIRRRCLLRDLGCTCHCACGIRYYRQSISHRQFFLFFFLFFFSLPPFNVILANKIRNPTKKKRGLIIKILFKYAILKQSDLCPPCDFRPIKMIN